MPSARTDVVGLLEEKKEDDRENAVKYTALAPHHDLLVYSMAPRKPPTLEEQSKNVLDQLQSAGTTHEVNGEDLMGDGDQSPVFDPYAQKVYKDIFRSGALLNTVTSASLTETGSFQLKWLGFIVPIPHPLLWFRLLNVSRGRFCRSSSWIDSVELWFERVCDKLRGWMPSQSPTDVGTKLGTKRQDLGQFGSIARNQRDSCALVTALACVLYVPQACNA
jgi:hypothetical protein